MQDRQDPQPERPRVLDAARAVKRGLSVAFSTDTVWGLGADPHDETAVERLYILKRRPAEKGLQVLCADDDTARRFARIEGDVASRFARLVAFWPGALTMVVPASDTCPEWLTRDGKVGVRVPASADARALLRACGGALASTSLNPSGDPPAYSYAQALALGLADVVLPGEDAAGQASTVYDVVMRQVLRHGAVAAEAIEEAVG